MVEVEEVHGEIVVRKAMTRAEMADELCGSLPAGGPDLLNELLEERRRDREREDRKFGDLS